MDAPPVIARKFAVCVALGISSRSSVATRLAVIGLTSLLVLSACKSTATVEMMATSESTNEPTESASGTSPESAGAAPVGDAQFVVRGELPLSTQEVNELISFIEQDTGRPFLRPPVIVAQSGEAFTQGLEESLGDFEAESDVSVRSLQALGLTDQGVGEVTQAFQNLLLSPEGVLGYYDPVPDELYVPVDTDGDDAFRSLLVHELTHALDGQYADLTVLDALVEAGDETGNYEPVVALQAVAEGRATSVQNRWMAENGVTQEVPDDLGAIEDVPPAMVLSLSIPYAFGEQYIESQGGAAATWDLLEAPPASSEVFMVAFGDASDEPIIDVATPTADGPILDEAVYGSADILTWLLGESLEPDPSLLFPTILAIDGWAGGRAVLWGDETESCMRIAIAADSDGDLNEIEEATRLWAANGTGRTVQVENGLVVVTGCAPYIE